MRKIFQFKAPREYDPNFKIPLKLSLTLVLSAAHQQKMSLVPAFVMF